MRMAESSLSVLPPVPPMLAERGYALRPEVASDEEFLIRLYRSTRWEELAPTGWSDTQKRAFLDSQFSLQDTHYRRYYAEAARGVVTAQGAAAGRLYLLQTGVELRIVDISLLSDYRGMGIGTALIGAVFALAHQAGTKVSIHVEVVNPARRLYERLGFQEAGGDGVYRLMEWVPGGILQQTGCRP